MTGTLQDIGPDDRLNSLSGICHQFEQTWQNGERTRIEEFLDGLNTSTLPVQSVAHLIPLELANRRMRGEVPTFSEYSSRFPHHGTLVARLFRTDPNDQTMPLDRRPLENGSGAPSKTKGDESSTKFNVQYQAILKAYKAAWQSPERPRLENYLSQVDPNQRAVFFTESIAYELVIRRGLNDPISAEEYIERFPQYAGIVHFTLSNDHVSEEQLTASEVTTGVEVHGPSEHHFEPGHAIAGCEIIKEIGRGGTGVVYLAHELALNRMVALKTIRSGAFASDIELTRIKSEAASAARLDHPCIVPVYGVGEHEGCPYFIMGYVDGPTLRERLTSAGPMDSLAAARMTLQLCEAITHAHQHGIVHRDLKPGNILLDHYDRPRITDFGLAKDISSDSSMTKAGEILGTPSYMAPEQAMGDNDAVGPAADIYALGAMLYEAVTDRPPFRAATAWETLAQVAETDPAMPRHLNPHIPKDLETIILKCLHKSPGQRYAEASDLASDLQMFISGCPIKARPISSWERGWRWSRRNRSLAFSIGAIAAMMILMLALSTISAEYFRDLTKRNERLAQQYAGERDKAESALQHSQLLVADLFTRMGADAIKDADPHAAALYYATAIERTTFDRHRQETNTVRAQTTLDRLPQPLAMFDSQDDIGSVREMVFDASLNYLLALPRDPNYATRVWNIPSREAASIGKVQAFRSGAIDHEGSTLALAAKSKIWIVSLPEFKVVKEVEWDSRFSEVLIEGEALAQDPHLMAFLPYSGLLVVVIEDRAFLYDWQQDRLFPLSAAYGSRIASCDVSPQGDQVAIVTSDNRFQTFQRTDGEWIAQRQGQALSPMSSWGRPRTTFYDRGRRLITLPTTNTLAFWSAGENEPEQAKFTAELYTVRVNSTDDRVAVGTTNGLYTVEGSDVQRLVEQNFDVLCTAWLNDGSLLYGGANQTLWRWVPGREKPLPLLRNTVGFLGIQLSRDNRLLAAQGYDRRITVWRLPEEKQLKDFNVAASGAASYAVFSEDSALALTISSRGWFQVTDLATQETVTPRLFPKWSLLDAAFVRSRPQEVVSLSLGPDRRRLRLDRWDIATSQLIGEPIVIDTDFAEDWHETVSPWGFCESREEFGVVTEAGVLRRYDLKQWEAISPTRCRDGHRYVSYSPNGQMLATFGISPQTTLDLYSYGDLSRPVLSGPCFNYKFTPVVMSPGGRVIAIRQTPEIVQLYDTETLQKIGPPLQHPSITYYAVFSKDDRFLATSCKDGYVRIWDTAKQEQVGTMIHCDDAGIAFLSDSRYLACVNRASEADLYDWQTGLPVVIPRSVQIPTDVAYLGGRKSTVSPDGTWLAIGGHPAIAFLQLPLLEAANGQEAPASLVKFTEFLANRSIDDTNIQVLSEQEIWQRFQELDAAGEIAALEPPDEAPSARSSPYPQSLGAADLEWIDVSLDEGVNENPEAITIQGNAFRVRQPQETGEAATFFGLPMIPGQDVIVRGDFKLTRGWTVMLRLEEGEQEVLLEVHPDHIRGWIPGNPGSLLTKDVPPGEFVNLAMLFTGKLVILYIDGEQVASTHWDSVLPKWRIATYRATGLPETDAVVKDIQYAVLPALQPEGDGRHLQGNIAAQLQEHFRKAASQFRGNRMEAVQRELDEAEAIGRTLLETAPLDREWARTYGKLIDLRQAIQCVTPLRPLRLNTKEGTKLILDDGNFIRPRGELAQQETYVIHSVCRTDHLRYLRLDAYPDPGLPNFGPGTGHGGNFLLTGIRIQVADAADADDWQAISYGVEEVSYEADGPLEAVLRGDPSASPWGVFGRVGELHWTVLELDLPPDLPEQVAVKIEIQFEREDYTREFIGKLVLSASAENRFPDLQDSSLSRVSPDEVKPGVFLLSRLLQAGQTEVASRLMERLDRDSNISNSLGYRLQRYILSESQADAELAEDLWNQVIAQLKQIAPTAGDAAMLRQVLREYRDHTTDEANTFLLNLERERVLRELNSAIERDPESAAGYNDRGHYLASIKEYSQASEDLLRAFELEADDRNRGQRPGMWAAILLAASDDPAKYHDFQWELLERFADTDNIYSCDRIAKVVSLKVSDPSIHQRALVLAQRAIEQGEQDGAFPWFLASRALAALRVGEVAEAIDYCDRIASDEDGHYRRSLKELVLCLARIQQNDLAKAEQSLQFVERRLSAQESGFDENRVIAEVLYAEAREKLAAAKAMADLQD